MCGATRLAVQCAAIGSLLKEFADVRACVASNYTNIPACESAMQASDFRDNAAGRKFGQRCGAFVGLRPLRPPILMTYLSDARRAVECCCMQLCDKQAPVGSLEGPGTSRPFGPYHPWPGFAGRWPTPAEFFQDLPADWKEVFLGL